jgi:putative ABC transport system permease protein
MLTLLRRLSWPEMRHQPWRTAAALVSIMLGVALAFSVHLINQSALGEFSSAVRAVDGQPDFELRAQAGGFDEALYARVAALPQVALASPIVEVESVALDAAGGHLAIRVIGLDALVAGRLSPALAPQVAAGFDRLAVILPDVVFLNAQARRALGEPKSLRLQTSGGVATLRVAGHVAAPGPALAVMDIAGAQQTFGWLGRLSRIDVRLAPGADRSAVIAALRLPPGVHAVLPGTSAARIANASRAYRVNLTVLALVALFTGAFLVYSILALSVARRQPQLALLGVLGLAARQRLALVLSESAVLGAIGSALGLGLGTGLALLALRLLAGDLGGGYFPGIEPQLHFGALAAAIYAVLGVAAALVGGWLPARQAQQLAPAQALKRLGSAADAHVKRWLAPALLLLGAVLALLPPLGDVPLAAYLSVACLLVGGIAGVPAGVALLLRWVGPPTNALALLAVERARRQRHSATIAVAGVVAALSLAVALTVMVSSFRESVVQWLGTVLPADLYIRSAGSGVDRPALPPALVAGAARVTGVQRVQAQRITQVQLDPKRPAVTLIARPIADAASELPLVGRLAPLPPGAIACYVSEPMVDLYGARPGTQLELPLPDGRMARLGVRGVWRDYARQFGAVTLALADYRRLSGDDTVNELALWLEPGAPLGLVQQAMRTLAADAGYDPALLEFASVGEIRQASLRIFDRSFAVTYWLQAVAIAIGLFGVAASFSAQVLARRKEFGLLAHLGLTRAQVLAVVAAEAAVWTAAGALLGLLLGLAVSVVLVDVVNPQSFHWTMQLLLPWGRLALLCSAVVVAGTATAWFAARHAASPAMALAVKEDW